jgi:uncharacterized RDD family membrane protein YckC
MGNDHDAARPGPAMPPHAPVGFRAPTFGQRLLGRLIDTVVLMVLVTVAIALASMVATDGMLPVVGLLVAAAYEIVLVALRGQTVGKMAMGTCIIDRDSGALPYLGQATTRWLVVAAGSLAATALPLLEPVVPVYAVVVLGPILQRPLHRGLHDRASGTLVTALAR